MLDWNSRVYEILAELRNSHFFTQREVNRVRRNIFRDYAHGHLSKPLKEMVEDCIRYIELCRKDDKRKRAITRPKFLDAVTRRLETIQDELDEAQRKGHKADVVQLRNEEKSLRDLLNAY